MDRDKNDCSCTSKVRYWNQAVLPVIVGLRGCGWRVFGFLGMSRNSHFDIVAEVATPGGPAEPRLQWRPTLWATWIGGLWCGGNFSRVSHEALSSIGLASSAVARPVGNSATDRGRPAPLPAVVGRRGRADSSHTDRGADDAGTIRRIQSAGAERGPRGTCKSEIIARRATNSVGNYNDRSSTPTPSKTATYRGRTRRLDWRTISQRRVSDAAQGCVAARRRNQQKTG